MALIVPSFMKPKVGNPSATIIRRNGGLFKASISSPRTVFTKGSGPDMYMDTRLPRVYGKYRKIIPVSREEIEGFPVTIVR
jgi:hypothetical protein